MAYLRRRIEALLADLGSGKTVITPGTQGMVDELKKVRRYSDGRVNLDSVTPALRSMARAYDLAVKGLESRDEAPPSSELVPAKEITELSRELLDLQGEMFAALTGVPVHNAPVGRDQLAAVIRNGARGFRNRERQLHRADADLRSFYAKKAPKLFTGAKQLAGLKLVHGGMQSYNESVFSATSSMVLYADTILVPDPVFRWFEHPNPHERYQGPRMIEDIRHIARLSKLIAADLPYPAIVVFPSWEKSLESSDAATQDAVEMMMLQAVGAWVTLAASMLPIFPALTPIAATAIGAAYIGSKAGETVERRQLKNTLTGVLAASARGGLRDE